MSGITRCGITRSLPRMALAALLSGSASGALAAEPAGAADTFDMQSDWRLDLRSGQSVRKNRFYGDAAGSRVTGNSEWHQQCERAPYSGMPAG